MMFTSSATPVSTSVTSATTAPPPPDSDTFEPEAGVDNTYRDNLQKMERIRTTLAARASDAGNAPKLNLPQMVVIGDQSAGKSALMSELTGVPFPSESGITTKCPAVVNTKYNVGCTEIAFELENANGDFTTHTSETLPKAILARQQGLLGGSKVVATPIVIHGEGCMCNDLTLVDLPGIISNGNEQEKEDILTMIRTYIEPPQSLILVVTEAKQDEEGARAIELAREVDPDGERTLRILTKYDNFDTDESHARANEWVCNTANAAHHAPHAVICRIGGKQYNQADEARILAADGLPKEYSGVESLRTRLSVLLCKLIDTNLPDLQKQICHVRKTAETRLHEIGTSPPDKSAILARVLATLRRKNNEYHTFLEVGCTPALNTYKEAIHQTEGFLTAELVDEHHHHNAFHCPFFQGETTFNTLLQLVRDEWLPLADTLHGEIATVLDTVFDIEALPDVSQKLIKCIANHWHSARQQMLSDLHDALHAEINKEAEFKTMNHYLTAKYKEKLVLPEEVQEKICEAITLSTLGTPPQNTFTGIDIETLSPPSHESAHTSLVRVNLQQVHERVQEIMKTKFEEYAEKYASASLEEQHKTRVLAAAKANWSAAHKTVTDSALDAVRRTVLDAVEKWLTTLNNDAMVHEHIKEDAGITREREQCTCTIHDMEKCEAILRGDEESLDTCGGSMPSKCFGLF